jgi:hypothetical protein
MKANLTSTEGVNYTSSVSSYSGDAFKCFNKSSADQWSSGSPVKYSATTGQYTGAASTTVNGAAVLGEWIELVTSAEKKMYNKIAITPTQLDMFKEISSPRDFTVAAFVDGAWVSALQRTDITDWTTEVKKFAFDTPVSTQQLRLIVSRVGNFDSHTLQDLLIVSEIEFFEALPYIVEKSNVLEQRIADLVQAVRRHQPRGRS